MKNKRYHIVLIGGIITQIATQTEVKGYTKGVIESFLPDDDELEKMSEQEEAGWIIENNRRMSAICQFLNDEKL
jgi:hypothetical protein